MIQDPKEIIGIWTRELTEASTKIVQAKLAGEDVENVAIDVTIQIPDPLFRAIVTASEKTGSDPDEILSEMASQGFQASIDQQLQVGKPKPPAERTLNNNDQSTGTGKNPMEMLGQLKGLGLDMSGIESKMSEFTNLMNMLNGMKEQMDDATKYYKDMQSDGEDSEDTE